MHTLSNLPTRFPHLTNDVSLLLSTNNVSKISADIHQDLGRYSSSCKCNGCDDCQHLSEFVKKLQQNLSSQLHEAMQIPACKLRFYNQIGLQLNVDH